MYFSVYLVYVYENPADDTSQPNVAFHSGQFHSVWFWPNRAQRTARKPTLDQTLATTKADIDLIASENKHHDLSIQFNNRAPAVRLVMELRKFVCDDDDKPAIGMAAITAKFNEMKMEMAASLERLKRRIMKVEKGKLSAHIAAVVNAEPPLDPQQPQQQLRL